MGDRIYVFKSGARPKDERSYLRQILDSIGVAGSQSSARVDIQYVSEENLNNEYLTGFILRSGFDTNTAKIRRFSDRDGGRGIVLTLPESAESSAAPPQMAEPTKDAPQRLTPAALGTLWTVAPGVLFAVPAGVGHGALGACIGAALGGLNGFVAYVGSRTLFKDDKECFGNPAYLFLAVAPATAYAVVMLPGAVEFCLKQGDSMSAALLKSLAALPCTYVVGVLLGVGLVRLVRWLTRKQA